MEILGNFSDYQHEFDRDMAVKFDFDYRSKIASNLLNNPYEIRWANENYLNQACYETGWLMSKRPDLFGLTNNRYWYDCYLYD